MIQVDSRRAGAGKTTRLYDYIAALRGENIPVLVVVPSIALQRQYEARFGNPDPMQLINSETSKEGVSRSLLKAMKANIPFICVTSNAWMRTAIPREYREQYHLIFDEAIKPYDFLWIDFQVPNGLTYMEQLRTILAPPDRAYWEWINLDVVSGSPKRCILSNPQAWEKIEHGNYRKWVRHDEWSEVCADSAGDITIALELRPQSIMDWRGVFIAAAAFEYTFMYMWLCANNISIRIDRNDRFEPHTQVPDMWSPERFIWSKNKRNQDDGYLKSYYHQVSEILNGNPCLLLRNTDDDMDHGLNAIPVAHNPHGLNQYQHITNICVACAINPKPNAMQFYRNQVDKGMNLNSREVTSWIFRAFCVYDYYQVIMRTALRNRNNTHRTQIFVLDSRVRDALMDFFDFDIINIKELDIQEIKKSRSHKIHQSNADKQRAYRQRKKAQKTGVTSDTIE